MILPVKEAEKILLWLTASFVFMEVCQYFRDRKMEAISLFSLEKPEVERGDWKSL